MTTRRDIIRGGLIGFGAWLANERLLRGGGFGGEAFAATDRPLIDQVAALCTRLAPLGWRQLLLDVTNGGLDITAVDLRSELAKPLATIDRDYPGFGDFARAGQRAIEPGKPDYSLLYHALAAPTVAADRSGKPLGGFPMLAEIEIVENYVYAARAASLNALRVEANGAPLAIVTFALQYRNAPMSVSGRHAQLCFARTGIARIGDLEPLYDDRLRCFVGLDESKPFSFRVEPRRFAAYLAVQMHGGAANFGPQDALADDRERSFWVPIHKLFSGRECIAGMDLRLELTSGLRNDELAAFHRFLEFQGYRNNYSGEVLDEFPFVIRDERIATLSRRSDYGTGILVPKPSPLIEEAVFKGKRVTFPVDHAFTGEPQNLQMSSPFVLPLGAPGGTPRYLDDAEQERRRPAPQYINARHKIVGNETINLNDRPDMMDVIAAGSYDAQHYIDATGDGWVIAACPELQTGGVAFSVPAFCMVGLPDFLPNLNQRDLMLWWRNEVPEPLRAALWAVPPLALSQTRIAANIELPIGFRADDDTIGAIVAQPVGAEFEPPNAPAQIPNGPLNPRKVGLPDGSPGLFDPGWDGSLGTDYDGATHTLRRFLVGHGLGSPFIEDAKLCAALGSYWPGVAPEATRQYQPDKLLSGLSYPWPSIAPPTDEEIGIVPTASGKTMSWDGVPGPQRRKVGDRAMVAYHDEMHVDYIDLLGTMTAALTARIDAADYKARILAMAAVYWSLGIQRGDPTDPENVNKLLREKSSWAVLSFHPVQEGDAGLVAASEAARATLKGPHRYFIDLFRWGDHMPDPGNFKIMLVEMLEEVTAYSDGRLVLLKRGDTWAQDSSIPT